MAVAVWGPASDNPYFDALHGPLLDAETVSKLSRPFVLADPDRLQLLLEDAGLSDVRLETLVLLLRLPALEEFVPRHLTAVSIADELATLSSEDVDAMIVEMRSALQPREDAHEGRVPFTILVARARRTV